MLQTLHTTHHTPHSTHHTVHTTGVNAGQGYGAAPGSPYGANGGYGGGLIYMREMDGDAILFSRESKLFVHLPLNSTAKCSGVFHRSRLEQ